MPIDARRVVSDRLSERGGEREGRKGKGKSRSKGSNGWRRNKRWREDEEAREQGRTKMKEEGKGRRTMARSKRGGEGSGGGGGVNRGGGRAVGGRDGERKARRMTRSRWKRQGRYYPVIFDGLIPSQVITVEKHFRGQGSAEQKCIIIFQLNCTVGIFRELE